jgi:hypothetical protein
VNGQWLEETALASLAEKCASATNTLAACANGEDMIVPVPYWELQKRLTDAKEARSHAKTLRPFLKNETECLLNLINLDIKELEDHLANVKKLKCTSCSGKGSRFYFFKCKTCEGDGHTYVMDTGYKWGADLSGGI